MGLSIEIISIIGFIASISIFSVLYFRLVRRLKQAIQISAELFFTNQALEQSLGIGASEEIADIHKENFIKFLSDSREWAFSYIEDVQVGLKSFIKEVEPAINHFNKFGIVTEGMPHYKDMKKISEEFYKLKKLLPKEIDDRR